MRTGGGYSLSIEILTFHWRSLMGGSQSTIKLVSLVRGAGFRVFLRKALEQTWWTKLFFTLRCDCDSLPPIRRAKIEITMKPWQSLVGVAGQPAPGRARGQDRSDGGSALQMRGHPRLAARAP